MALYRLIFKHPTPVLALTFGTVNKNQLFGFVPPTHGRASQTDSL